MQCIGQQRRTDGGQPRQQGRGIFQRLDGRFPNFDDIALIHSGREVHRRHAGLVQTVQNGPLRRGRAAQLAKAEYRDLWIDATTPLVGAENAETATDTLLAMCMAEPYGPEASEKYAADPESMAFNCYFRGGVDRFVMDGHTISGLDAQGNEVFSHTYHKLDEKNENGFLFYQSDDADSGDFTYFAFSPDTMETTYHLEFRYAEDLSDLQSWFEGNYAYWNAAAIAVDYDQETMKNVIELFVTENLTEAE